MATRKFTTRARRTRSRNVRRIWRAHTHSDLGTILGKLADSRAVIETACKAMESDEHGSDVITLRTGLTILDGAYNALDTTIARLS